jgi:hypothetical protein
VPGLTYRILADGPQEMPVWMVREVTVRPGEVKDLGDLKPLTAPPR